jgi:hypothetical protein
MADYDTLIAKSKELAAAGRLDDARRVAEIALKARSQPKPFSQRLRENVFGDNDPTTQNFGEKVGSALNKAGEALTFGLVGDEASAAVESLAPGVNYADRRDHYRQQEQVLDENNPALSLGAELGGAVGGAMLPFGAIGTLGRGASMARRAGASTAAGAGLGAVYGAAEGEGVDDRISEAGMGAAIGAAGGLAAPFLGGAAEKAADYVVGGRAIRSAARNAPSTDELRRAGQAAYRQIDDAGVQIRPESFNRTKDAIRQALRGQGLDELPGPSSLTPKSARVMQIADEMGNEMATDPSAALPFSSLDQLRRHAGTAARSPEATDAALGAETISQLDDAVRSLGSDDIVAGDLETLQTVLPKARDLWARMSRSQLVDDAIDASQDYLSGGSSGIRNQFRRILRNDKLSRGFSDAEKAAMRRVVNGSVPEQVLNLLGGGVGQLAQIGAGFGVGGVPGALAGMGTAALSRKGSEALTERGAETVRAMIANGGMQTLPVARDTTRKIIEGLLRRGPVAVNQ